MMKIILHSITFFSLLVCTVTFANSQNDFANLEKKFNGRLGISAIDMTTQKTIRYRANERFPMGCTSKVMGVAAILKQSMSQPDLLKENVTYQKNSVVSWSPITEKHISDGMTIFQLCEAAITVSDNTAMNLLVKKLGGLNALNQFAHSIGNAEFYANHLWPEEANAGGIDNKDDSSTPEAMRISLQKLTFGNMLSSPLREQLLVWLKQNTTGNQRIRAGVPSQWVVGDKTGTGALYGTTNDIGIIWPPKCPPLVVAIYFTSIKPHAVKQDDVVAEATRILIREFAKQNTCYKIDLNHSTS